MKLYSKEYTIPSSGVLSRNAEQLMKECPRLNLPAKAIMITAYYKGIQKDNFEVLGAVDDKSFTVPAGKRWLVYGGRIERDASATMTVNVYNSDDKLIMTLHYISAGTSDALFPTVAGYPVMPTLLKVGDYIKYAWGATQTTPEVSLLVEEFDEEGIAVWVNEDEQQYIELYEPPFRTPVIPLEVMGFKIVGTATRKVTVYLFYEPMKGVISGRKIERGSDKQI